MHIHSLIKLGHTSPTDSASGSKLATEHDYHLPQKRECHPKTRGELLQQSTGSVGDIQSESSSGFAARICVFGVLTGSISKVPCFSLISRRRDLNIGKVGVSPRMRRQCLNVRLCQADVVRSGDKIQIDTSSKGDGLHHQSVQVRRSSLPIKNSESAIR